MNPDSVRLPVALAYGQHYYLAQVGIGTMIRDQPQTFNDYYLIMDTGSDLTWTQCQGGTSYFYQDEPIFPHQDSRTYRPLPCEDHRGLCGEENCNDQGYCTYREVYFSGQVTSGDLAIETFTTNSDDEDAFEIVDFLMGCGFEQRNWEGYLGVLDIGDGHQLPKSLPQRGTAPVAGMLGLGQGGIISLVL
ncbi:aspartic proteinase nepenthesin-2-like [Papaver somniferum]|uniref:aspartic proteinase nepenthesin-2-like n=1 Tax=Papaver somniferum TaxID=3469 RepID=UPI000E6F9F21|nr:aspartic proteinase nepenthesin-2-like [Papaver somniferum]